MKIDLSQRYFFKECKKCPVKNKKKPGDAIVSPCQNCIANGKAMPPPKIHTEIKF